MRFHVKFSPIQTLAAGFALIILLGALLLMLPAANRDGAPIPLIDALFTSASATCVTGLVVYDTYTQFTFFGQLVILCLIQIGGLGFMTIAVLFSLVLGKRIGLKERSCLMEAVSSFRLGGIVRFVRRILIGTAAFEGAGALLLALRFCPRFGFGTGVWYAIFHSVSAFCNAGFDLMGRIRPYCSLEPFAADVLVNGVVLSLIVIGGIGFLVWDDLAEHRLHFSRYLLHTKIMLCATAALIVLSFFAFWAIERDGAFAGVSRGQQALMALFQAITPRTAGFNTADLSRLTEAGSALTVVLMLIGAGTGSTGGGIKVTTMVVMLLSTLSYARGRDDINLFQRRVEDGLVKRAYCGAMLYLLLAFTGCFVLLREQAGFSLMDAMFETFSAIGTVGLSKGATRLLTPASRMTLILLMYSGRVGSLSVAMALAEKRRAPRLRNTVGKVIVG